jgi:signal transduction histidine kinase
MRTEREIDAAAYAAAQAAIGRLSPDAVAALFAATASIVEVLDLDRVLQRIVDRVRELIDAEYAALGIVDADGRIERFITSGIDAATRRRLGDPPQGHGLLGLIIREGRSLRIPNISRHPDSYGFPPHHPPMRSLLGVPITIHGRTTGNFYLTDKRGAAEFSEEDELLAQMFATQAAIAIDNARLHDQVQRLAVVEERERIGRDLHDGIIQGIYAVALSLEDVPELMADEPAEAVERVDRAIDALNASIREIRNFILGLQSEFVGGADLPGGLATLAREFQLNAAIDIAVDVAGGAEASRDLPASVRVNLLQMAREVLSNTARHSRAGSASIRLVERDGTVELAIDDDGVGFDPATTPGSAHLGLANLRDRAAAIGASLAIDSAPGAGTRIIARVPLLSGAEESPRA